MDFDEFKNLKFESSIQPADFGQQVDEKVLVEKIKDALDEILHIKFSSIREKRVINYSLYNRINFACPYCGDSKTNYRKKRGNLYKDDFNYKCWNCGTFKDFETFMGDHDMKKNFNSSEIKFIRDAAKEHHVSGFGGVSLSTQIQDLFNVSEFAIPRETIMKHARLVNVEQSKRIFSYLRRRLQIPRDGDTRHLAYDRVNDMIYVFNMDTTRTKVFGMQGRFMKKPKSGQRFYTMKYSDIWSKVLDVEIKDDVKQLVDKFSLIYNILHVNFGKDVYVFEGAFDSHHINNSIAQMGTGNQVWLPMGKYFFDNATIDEAGKKAAIDALNRGHSVFLWSKFLDENPQYVKKENGALIKDLNDVVCKQWINESQLSKYFSTSELDMIYL